LCCSVLQDNAVCRSVLHCVELEDSFDGDLLLCYSVLQCVAVCCMCCSVLQCVVRCCSESGLRVVTNVSRSTLAACWSMLPCVAVWCSAL